MEFSYTMLHSYMTCEYSYYLRYIERVPIKESSASVFGTAVHRTIKIGYDNDLPRDEWAKIFRKEWMALTSNKDIVFSSEGEYLKKFKDGADMVTNYYDKFVKRHKPPQMTEFFFGRDKAVKIGEHIIIGVFDQIDAKDRVIDYKSGVKPTKNKLDLDLQFTIYSYAYRQLFGKEEGGLILRHLGTMKDLTTTRTEDDFRLLEEEVDKVAKRLKGKLFIRSLDRGCDNCYFFEHCLGKERIYGRRQYS
ncbi:MAG: PD-(D/E)XK nuclease family protein [Candidatus Portnoybacteria bacterium]|nr:PD-(D/E)XK nuclease family protein [Candidatus Portnoybacteria bacterium]